VQKCKLPRKQKLAILALRDDLLREEKQKAKAEAKAAKTRDVFVLLVRKDGTQFSTEQNFLSQRAFELFLKANQFYGLAQVLDSSGIRKDFFIYDNLTNGQQYVGLMKDEDLNVIDVPKEVREMLLAVRSKVDFDVCRKLSEVYKVKVEFVAHDVKLWKSGIPKDSAGDIDSLFSSEDTDFLVERKRTVNGSIVEQVTRTREAYKASLESQGKNRNIVSVVYSWAINDQYVQELLNAGIHVMYDSIETKFFKDFLKIKEL
jgi:hypothetical protein